MISVVHIRYCKLNEKEDAKVIKSDDKRRLALYKLALWRSGIYVYWSTHTHTHTKSYIFQTDGILDSPVAWYNTNEIFLMFLEIILVERIKAQLTLRNLEVNQNDCDI